MLPVLLDSLRGDWQANELARPLARLKAMDNNGLLRRTLAAWFRHNVQPLATSKALFIHRNTLEYRLNRISELTGLDLGNFDDRLLLYVALQLMRSGRGITKLKPGDALPGLRNDIIHPYLRVSFSVSASISLILLVTTDLCDVNRRGSYA